MCALGPQQRAHGVLPEGAPRKQCLQIVSGLNEGKVGMCGDRRTHAPTLQQSAL